MTYKAEAIKNRNTLAASISNPNHATLSLTICGVSREVSMIKNATDIPTSGSAAAPVLFLSRALYHDTKKPNP